MRNKHHSSHFTIIKVFPGLGPILTAVLKYRLTVKFFQIFFLLANCPMKIKVCEAENNWFVFKEAPAYKRGKRRSAHPRHEQG